MERDLAAIRRLVTPLVLLAGLALSTSLQAATVFPDGYFATLPLYTCTASNVANPSTYHRQYRPNGTIGSCPGYSTYVVRKGQKAYPWSSESFLHDTTSGYIEIMNEVSTIERTGRVTSNRVFRDPVTLEKGLPWLPISFNSVTGKSWVVDSWIETWVDANGYPSCSVTQQTPTLFHSTLDLVQYLGVWSAWIQDKRGSSPNKNAWHDVDVIKKTGIWGTNPEVTENYYYAKRRNPSNQQWEGIGLIKFEYFENGVLRSGSENRYLVDCLGLVLCPTCPP